MPGFISLRNNYTPGSIVTVGNADLNLELWAVIAGIFGFYDEESPICRCTPDVHGLFPRFLIVHRIDRALDYWYDFTTPTCV